MLVIGGSSGIGLELVKILVHQGYTVYAGSRTSDAFAGLPDVRHFAVDVRDEFLALKDLPPELHGLAYCPGTIRLRPFQRLSNDEFLEDFRINHLGAVKVVQACLPHLKKPSSGASVVLFSTVAVKTGMPLHASVASAKGAVEGLTLALAAEFAPCIRFNAIAASLTDTPLAENLLSSEDKRRAAAERHPLKRIGSVRDIAHLAAHLLSDNGSWITGQILHADGGLGSLRIFK